MVGGDDAANFVFGTVGLAAPNDDFEFLQIVLFWTLVPPHSFRTLLVWTLSGTLGASSQTFWDYSSETDRPGLSRMNNSGG